MENLPFPDEIILKFLGYLSFSDFVKCSQVSKQLHKICKDKEFQHHHELKKMIKTINKFFYQERKRAEQNSK